MGKIFKGQSSLRITVNTFADLEDYITAVIKYRKPDGTEGEFITSVADEGKGVLFHECRAGEIDAYGWWAFWAHITFSDGRTAMGETVKVFVWEEGK